MLVTMIPCFVKALIPRAAMLLAVALDGTVRG